MSKPNSLWWWTLEKQVYPNRKLSKQNVSLVWFLPSWIYNGTVRMTLRHSSCTVSSIASKVIQVSIIAMLIACSKNFVILAFTLYLQPHFSGASVSDRNRDLQYFMTLAMLPPRIIKLQIYSLELPYNNIVHYFKGLWVWQPQEKLTIKGRAKSDLWLFSRVMFLSLSWTWGGSFNSVILIPDSKDNTGKQLASFYITAVILEGKQHVVLL